MKNRLSLVLFFCLVAAPVAPLCRAQTTPFLTDDEIRMLSNEISGDRSFEHIRWLSHWHRDSGMEGYFKAADYVVQAAKQAGADEVRFVEQVLPRPNYTQRQGELWITEPVEVKLADIGEHAVFLADGSHDADVTAEVVYIGEGSEEELKNLNVAGKIVLTSGSAWAAAQRAVYGRGAVGVISYETSENRSPMDFPDQIAWSRINVTPPEGKKGTFAFILPPRRGETLRRVLAAGGEEEDFFATGKAVKGGRLVVKAKVDTDISAAPGRTGFVEAVIRGTEPNKEQIVLTAHLQEEQGSANDDGSGCGNLLELVRVFNKLIKEGKIKRPKRDLRFWWTDEIYSEYRYFMDHPEETKKILANIHQDMTGANQAMGSRVQHLIHAPHSRTSYLDALFESVGNFVIHTNNGFLAASRQGGLPRPHTRPLYSTRGSRQGFNARFVPYFGSSDHMVFVEGAVGIPAVGLINWDDNYIHSTDDDLFQIDQTQLKRNNFIIGSLALILSTADEADVPVLTSETFAQGAKRMANDLQVAMGILRDSKGEPDGGWKRASYMIEQGAEREARAMNSIRVFAGASGDAARMIDGGVAQAAKHGMGAQLAAFYRQLHGAEPKPVALDAAEQAASRKVPANAATLKEYFDNRDKVPGQSRGRLHGLMRDEVFNFVDGRRSYYDIYKAVYAEAMAGGTWYYGTVTLADVVSLLDAAVAAKALTLK